MPAAAKATAFVCSSPHDGSAKSASLFSHGQPVIPLKNCRLARRREDRKMVPGDRAVRDTRTTGFEPEVSLAVLPTAQSETPVPPKSATVILAQETGARSPCAAPDAEPFRIAERPASIRSPPLVANAEFSPQPREVVGAHRILGTPLR